MAYQRRTNTDPYNNAYGNSYGGDTSPYGGVGGGYGNDSYGSNNTVSYASNTAYGGLESSSLKKNKKKDFNVVMIVCGVLALVGWIVAFRNGMKISTVSKEMERTKRNLNAEITRLKMHKEDHIKTHEKTLQKVDANLQSMTAENELLGSRESALRSNVDRLQKFIQKQSRLDVTEQFGAGPHFVRFDLQYPEKNVERVTNGEARSSEVIDEFFVAQLANIDTMPHSVHQFMEMVSLKKFDGWTFNRYPGHVLQVGANMEAFREDGYFHLSFSEYNSTYTHKPYTLGFAGRPSGPEFYINTLDNTVNHGPHGQKHHALAEEADPCFAQIVLGRDVIDSMTGRKLQGRKSIYFESPVTIKAVRLVFKSPDMSIKDFLAEQKL